MARKVKKRDVDEELLQSIFAAEREWKQIKAIMEKSIEPIESGINRQNLALAKYLFLLKEARHRKISAIRYN